MAAICLHCIVKGRVQGVFYRRHTAMQAEKLGVTGWVRNVPNGDVEVLICGVPEAVESLREWLWEGPEIAQVTEVRTREIPFEHHASFEVR